ncbi:MAG TPA: ABC transporter substrate-binding protein [Acidimicrobiales bacterium]|nr:ABC transporter substrate-binding protein [Acidimicrobiales bacterium]
MRMSGTSPTGRRARPRPRWRGPARAGALLSAAGLVLTACAGGTTPTAAPGGNKPVQGGTASFAYETGADFSWIFPLENEANFEPQDFWVENEMWRPLFYPGGPGKTGIDYGLSIANPPVYSDHNSTVTVTLKKGYKWSDGQPVTTSDVQFYFQLEAAGAKNGKLAEYVPGEMPDDVKSISYNGPYSFTIHMNRSYNPVWFTGNQLMWIYAFPKQTWDRTCASCPVGSAASTPAGANKVYDFLYGQSQKVSTYATNPIWKTVDGPWVLTSFDPTTYRTVLTANSKYTGPDKPHLHTLELYSFSSDTAELDAIRAGTIDFGWLPFSDVAALKSYENLGYTFKPWFAYYNDAVEFGYTSKTWGPLVRQLYVRQALQHLVDQPLYIKTALHGYGVQDYGVAPDVNSPYTAPALRKDPYPYSVSAAKQLLGSHGWTAGSNGVDVCSRPGTGSNECGAGITKGQPLSIELMYSTGVPSFLAEVEAFATAAKQAGVGINLNGQTTNTMFSIAGVCPPGPCNWGIAAYSGFMWNYGQTSLVPSGGGEFGKGNYWGGGYSSATADNLIEQAHTGSGIQALYNAETYLTKQVASLWFPVPAQYLLLVKNNLKGWDPLNPYNFPMPSRWYYVK